MISKPKKDFFKKVEAGGMVGEVKKVLNQYGLDTVCRSARCPNRSECYKKGTATFLILGSICTRTCRYCSVEKGKPLPPDEKEPEKVAEAVKRLNIRYAVLTSPTRDDLPDGGLNHFIKVVNSVKQKNPTTEVEVLVPDFGGRWENLNSLFSAGICVFNHNIEVVRSLFPKMRPQADYERSLRLLKKAADEGKAVVKSGMMVGLGETREEIIETLKDLKKAGVQVVTIGQYLPPTRNHLPAEKFYSGKEFLELEREAKKMGFLKVFSGPFVRSSYLAEEVKKEIWG